MSNIDENKLKFVEKKKRQDAADGSSSKPEAFMGKDNVPVIPGFDVSEDKGVGYQSFIKTQLLRNPFVPIGMIATVSALVFGLRAMARGDRRQSQIMMRYRVGFQFFTIVALCAGFVISGDAFRTHNDDDD